MCGEDRFAFVGVEREQLDVVGESGTQPGLELFVVEAVGELEHEPVGHLHACQEHAFDPTAFCCQGRRKVGSATDSATGCAFPGIPDTHDPHG